MVDAIDIVRFISPTAVEVILVDRVCVEGLLMTGEEGEYPFCKSFGFDADGLRFGIIRPLIVWCSRSCE